MIPNLRLTINIVTTVRGIVDPGAWVGLPQDAITPRWDVNSHLHEFGKQL